MPACPPRNRALPLLAAAALSAAVSGCTRYDDAQACADLSSMVWPWQRLDGATATITPVAGPLDTPAYGTEVVRVAGRMQLPAYQGTTDPEPLAASFECVHRGDLLQTFGWAEPNALARPELRVERRPRPPAAPQ